MNLEIPELLFRRLQKHATPLVDTPVTVIEKWADFYERHSPASAVVRGDKLSTATPTKAEEVSSAVRRLDPHRPPSLLYTTVRGDLADSKFSNWNDLLRIAHISAFEKLKTFEALLHVTRAQIRNGGYRGEGYHFIREIGISLQGVDSDHAWKYALRLAIEIKEPLKAEIEWRNNGKSAYPGERAVMSWAP